MKRNKIKTLVKKETNFVKRHQGLLLRVLGGATIAAVVLSFASLLSNSDIKPSATAEFAKTSVMIVNSSLRSGGSGVILRSSNNLSYILTNKHVCDVARNGGFVVKDNSLYPIRDYKRYKFHDLCMVRVSSNFEINTSVSNNQANRYSKAFISGHPKLLPHVLTTGNFSGYKIISVLMGFKECPENYYNDKKLNPRDRFLCDLFGVYPIIETFQSQLVTGTILPGSSGSGIFDTSGEISGLVFAGNGKGLGYAFSVPFEFVSDFVSKSLPSGLWTNKSVDNQYTTQTDPKDSYIFQLDIPKNVTDINGNINAKLVEEIINKYIVNGDLKRWLEQR